MLAKIAIIFHFSKFLGTLFAGERLKENKKEGGCIMAFIDYYKILGVDKTIPQKDVKRAYLKRAKQFHPDLHPDDPKAKAKFQALTEAYDVIGDPDKRAKYDKYGEQWKQAEAYEKAGAGFGGYGGSQGNPFEGFDFSSFGGGGGGFSSFFQDLFGGGMRGGQGFGAHTTYKEEPKNTQATVTIDMYTALLGGDIMVTTGSGERLKLKVKPETQPGTKVRLRGKGRGGTDLILTYQVKLPTGLTERQKQLLQQMQQG